MDTENFLLIRGERILQQILIEDSSYSDLEQNVVQNFPKTKKRQHAVDPIQIVQLSLFPFKPSGRLLAKALARSSPKKYMTDIMFLNVVYMNAPGGGSVSFKASNQKDYFISPIDLHKSNCKVRCECLDFRWRFAYYNNADNSLYRIPPKPYVKKTNREPVNPHKVPGVCKHILKTIMALSEAGLVK